ncbi:hypothetical protein BD779DRAFT_109322 [Infundibulicybe gibba]|nr:hypothetical protein BD779DRAFT_109322 [Infundibulicybe gibba]
MQALFGVGVLRKNDEQLLLSTWLPSQLKSGSVKLRQDTSNNYDVNDRIRDAHEHLAVACIEYMLSCTDPVERNRSVVTPGSYASAYWTSHLRHAGHSERLFEILRRVIIRRGDVEPVIEWLERSTNSPKDILCHWHTARLKHNTKDLKIREDKSLFYQYAYLKEYNY